jgi:hypothetical protein
VDSSGNKFDDDSLSITAKKRSAHHFELGTLATNRILFALTLLGVILPLNSIATHFHQLGFTYRASHTLYLKGSYHLRATYFFYSMETLLATAVYFYGFGFIFKWSIPDRIGTFLYACALLVPPIYIYLDIYSIFISAISQLNAVLFYLVNIGVNILFTVFFAGIAIAISNRLDG